MRRIWILAVLVGAFVGLTIATASDAAARHYRHGWQHHIVAQDVVRKARHVRRHYRHRRHARRSYRAPRAAVAAIQRPATVAPVVDVTARARDVSPFDSLDVGGRWPGSWPVAGKVTDVSLVSPVLIEAQPVPLLVLRSIEIQANALREALINLVRPK